MQEKTEKQIRNILLLIFTIMFLAVCKLTASESICIVLSIFIFILIWPFAAWLEKHRVPKALVSLICIIIIIAVIIGFGWFMVFMVNNLLVTVPKYAAKIVTLNNSLNALLGRWVDIPADSSFLSLLNVDWVSYLMKMLGTISTSLIGISKNLLITILMTAFLILERNTLIPKVKMASREEQRENVGSVVSKICSQVSKYLLEKVVISLVTGALFLLIASMVHLDFALLWGVLAFFMNFIPTIGSIVITVATIAMAVIQFFPNWSPIIFVIISTVAVQNILGNIIEPRIQGTSLDLSPFVIMVSLSIFSYIWGITGMFLAVPLLSILEVALSNIEDTKGVAIILSSGFSFKRRMKRERQRVHQPSLFD